MEDANRNFMGVDDGVEYVDDINRNVFKSNSKTDAPNSTRDRGKSLSSYHERHPPLTRRQKLTLLTCSCTVCFMHFGISSIPLVLPPEIMRKEIAYEYVGLIFAVLSFSIVIFEPLQAKILPRLGTKTVFCLAALLGGICYIAFATVDFANTTTSFVAPAMVICFIQGYYYASLITACNVIVCIEFPDRASFAFGVLEGFVGLGYTLGPLISGALVEVGGFMPPFFFIGSCLLLACLMGYVVLKQVTGINLEPNHKEKARLIRDPVFIGVAILIFAMGIIWGIFESTLEPYLATYEKGAIVEGAVFATAYLAYALSSPLWGLFFKKYHINFRWVLVGPVITGVLWLILGPIPALSFIGTGSEKSFLWLDCLCLFLLNITVAFVLVFCYDTMMKRAGHWGLEDNVATYSLVIASFFTALNFGEAVGPILAGYVYAEQGFQMVAVAASSSSFAIAIIGALALLVNWAKLFLRANRKLHGWFPSLVDAPSESELQNERSSLLPGKTSARNVAGPPETTRLLETSSQNSYGSSTRLPRGLPLI